MKIKVVYVRIFKIPPWLYTIFSKSIRDHEVFSIFYILSLNIMLHMKKS